MSAVRRLGVACAVAAFALDQGSKAIVVASPALAAGVEVLPFFNLVRGQNSGVTFGMFGGAPWWQKKKEEERKSKKRKRKKIKKE